MHRIAFKMKVFPGQEKEYEDRHNPIWKELEDMLFAHGVSSYSIFLDESNGDLFAYAETKDLKQWETIADQPICRKWWTYMAPLMETHPDDRPVAHPLREVFHIENTP